MQLSLVLASLSRTEKFPLEWSIDYFASGRPSTTRLYFWPGTPATPALLNLELFANPELPAGPIHKTLTILGDAGEEPEPLPAQACRV